MNLTQLKNLAYIMGRTCRPRNVIRAAGNPPSAGHGSASEARLAVCRRISTPCLLRRIARGRWSATSHDCAVRVLMDRDANGERA